jgi:outer membrane autotransporter protein
LAGTAQVSASSVASLVGSTLAGVITAGDTLSGAFTTINSNSSIYGYTGVYSSNAFGMVVAAQPNAVANDVAQYGTPAAAGAAAALDQIASNPGAMAPVIDTLDGLSGQAQANAVAQTLPVLAGASSMVTSQNQNAFNQVMRSRQAVLSGMSSGEEFAGNRDVWGKAFGNWANQGDLNNVSGYSVDGGGIAFGFDKQLSTKSNLGISLAYAYSSVSSNSSAAPSSVDINSYQLGLYGDYQLQPTWQVNYQLDGAYNTNSSTRSLSAFSGTTGLGANATGSYNSYVVHAGLGLQKFLSLNPNTRLTPEVRLDYTTVQTDSYTESGGGLLNLKANSQSYNTLYTSASLRLDHALSNGLNISGNVGIASNALDTKAQLTSAYQGGGPAFVTNGLDISPWLYNAGVGIGGMVGKNVELNVRYDIDFSSTSYTNQMVSARVKFLF